MLILLTDLIDIVSADDAQENKMWRELKKLADELNSNLPDYEVRLIHLDCDDYLEFLPKSDEEFLQEVGQ